MRKMVAPAAIAVRAAMVITCFFFITIGVAIGMPNRRGGMLLPEIIEFAQTN
jgi:hypothetical protein